MNSALESMRAERARSLELFAGAGGLAIGMARAGFDHAAVLEWNRAACETLRFNQGRSVPGLANWPIYEGDARSFDYASLSRIDVVSGGPPCQPFSLGGKHRGHRDDRDMFPEAVRAVRELRPKAFIFENVRGLLRPSFASYFRYIVLQLSHPNATRNPRDTWERHLARLERHDVARRSRDDLTYRVRFQLVNAADYGVPQKRERLILVGLRADLGLCWSSPEPTHGLDALLRDQWITGDYWERHRLARRARPPMTSAVASRVARLCQARTAGVLPWRTVRDAISDLPDPKRQPGNKVANHRFVPGARAYPGHTGSSLDDPAKTLKAGNHGVPGGENMLVHLNGTVRYFTAREAARLQTFPDEYEWVGGWSETMRQLGNAVPVLLGETIARSVAVLLRGAADHEGHPTPG